MESTGKARSARMERRTTPTCPVAPTMAMRIAEFYGMAAGPDSGGSGALSTARSVGVVACQTSASTAST